MSSSSSRRPSTRRSAAPQRARSHVRVEGISKSFRERRVLTDISFTLAAGQPTGLIGENGSGKSTLLRIIAGLVAPDAGTVIAHVPGPADPRIGYLHQEPPFAPEASVAEVLELAVAPVRAAAEAVDASASALAAAPEDRRAARAYDAALERAQRLDAWSVDARIEDMLAGLSLSDVPHDIPTGELSGGQTARLSLGWLLLNTPDVLLLDEPTNHLDDAASDYLASVLASWPGPVLIASHDRAFLDGAVRTLIDLDPSPIPHSLSSGLTDDGDGAGIGVTRFGGSYTDYVHARLDVRERWERQYRAEQAELKRLRGAVQDSHQLGHSGRAPRTEARAAKKFYSDRNATVVSRRVRDATSRLAELEENQVRKPPPELWFRGLTAADDAGGSTAPASGPVLAAAEVSVAGRLALTSLTVSAGEKWLVTGPNGTGKSTLLGVLAGLVEPSSGSVTTAGGPRIGLLRQDVDLPDPFERGPGRSAVQAYEDLVGAKLAARTPLSTFGLLAGRDENRAVEVLSTGQQRRLALAALLVDPPDVLLLDEPTNHLSLMLVTQLEAAIPDYPGAVVIASHDRLLRREWTGQRLEL